MSQAVPSSSLADIHEVNLSYLMLAQRLLRDNLAEGMYRLGVSEDAAEVLLKLTPAQLVKLASSSQLLCSFRLDDYRLINSLTQDVLGGILQQAHTAILLSRRETNEAEADDAERINNS